MSENKDKVLELMKCPITKKIMENPVVTYDENVYEREAIDEIFISESNTDPITGKQFISKNYVKIPQLAKIIKEYSNLSKKPKQEIDIETYNKLLEKSKEQEKTINELRVDVPGRIFKEAFMLGVDFNEQKIALNNKIKDLESENFEMRKKLLEFGVNLNDILPKKIYDNEHMQNENFYDDNIEN